MKYRYNSENKYPEIIFIRWTFNFMYFVGWAIHKFKIPTLSKIKKQKTQIKVSTIMSFVLKP